MSHSSSSPSIREIRDAIRAGTRTVEQTVQQAFDAAQRLQPELQAFIHLPASPIVNRADRDAPLAGVPVGIKDLIDTADMPTAYGSPAYEGRRPDKDAWVAARLREAGATILGKTVTTEFAWRQPGATTNPWNSDHTPGGSSSGSAAAVAAGIVPLALGTQTFGSVIRPAAYCGVVGVKPSYGTIARTGVLPLSRSLDHLGVFTTNVVMQFMRYPFWWVSMRTIHTPRITVARGKAQAMRQSGRHALACCASRSADRSTKRSNTC
jgi:Asp-tRNA(Asn)/Glu-tRNA(Gln) amidotransferase A subunit family amidase